MKRPRLRTQSRVVLLRPLFRPRCPSQLPLRRLQSLHLHQPLCLLQSRHLFLPLRRLLAQQCQRRRKNQLQRQPLPHPTRQPLRRPRLGRGNNGEYPFT